MDGAVASSIELVAWREARHAYGTGEATMYGRSGEVVMEPLVYNPNMGGWWGAKIVDAPEWEWERRRKHPAVEAVRGRIARTGRPGERDVRITLPVLLRRWV